MTETITCKYTCDLCGIDEQDVAVPIRGREQDIIDWMENTVGYTLRDDHNSRSDHCRPKTLMKVMIPTPAGSPMIGRPAEH